jgi:prepilin-type N-terminal cleavage/methylation domain-containing protein
MAARQQIILPRPHRQSAFTLIELLISVAIALVLVLGVNQVFKIASQTVGTGQAFSAVTRDERVAHFSVYTDVHNALTVAQPALMISSQSVVAFNTQQDASNEPSGVPGTITINGVAQPVSYALASSRNFRIDTLGFFASGDLYQRQTANDQTFVSPTTSSSAYIWYGHLALPSNSQAQSAGTYSTPVTPVLPPSAPPPSTQWFGPGWPDSSTTLRNDNNRYAADWILGRVAMLFVPTPPTGDNYLQYNVNANPLASNNTSTTDGIAIFTSRYDEVGCSVTQFNSAAAAYLTTNPLPATPPMPSGFRTPMFFRYCANPFPIKPLTAANMAAAAPIFLRHCSQFIVEYAGDYLTQDNNPYLANGSTPNPNYGNVGSVTNSSDAIVTVNGAQGDGVVDFVADKTASLTNPALWTRRIRWYGFPRDTNNDGAIDLQHDVVPLRDVLQAAIPNGAGQPSTTNAPWEVVNFLVPSNNNYATTGNVVPTSQYLCSWGAETQWPVSGNYGTGLPRMLRITLALDDPAGRLASPQIYEYVIDLGSQQ